LGLAVTETVYNADDSVQIVKKAVGSSVAQNYATYTYSNNGLPTTVKDAKNNLATYAYDDLSRRTTVTLGNSTTTSYGYSTQSAVATLTHNLTGTAQDQTYTYTRNQVNRPGFELTPRSWAAAAVANHATHLWES